MPGGSHRACEEPAAPTRPPTRRWPGVQLDDLDVREDPAPDAPRRGRGETMLAGSRPPRSGSSPADATRHTSGSSPPTPVSSITSLTSAERRGRPSRSSVVLVAHLLEDLAQGSPGILAGAAVVRVVLGLVIVPRRSSGPGLTADRADSGQARHRLPMLGDLQRLAGLDPVQVHGQVLAQFRTPTRAGRSPSLM